MSEGERRLKRAISQRITLAPKREKAGCAFKRCCEEKCLNEIRRASTHQRTKEEIFKAVSLRTERINLLSESEEGSNSEANDRIAGKLAQIIQGSAIPIDCGGTIDYSFCGDGFKIQTYSIEEMRKILAMAPLEISIKSAYVSGLRGGRPTGLSENFADLLAWIAALKGTDGSYLERLMRHGGVNGMRAIARIIGEPALDEKTREKFIVSLCILSSCISSSDGKVIAKNEELAESISRFSTFESYDLTSSGRARKKEFGGLPCPLPNLSPEPHMMWQMSLVAIGALFQANMNLANRIDSIINSGEGEIEENSERLRGMFECLKLGIGNLLEVDRRTMEFFADTKIAELYGRHTPLIERGAGMDSGEQNIAKYAVAKIVNTSRLNTMSLEHFYGLLPASENCPKETSEKLDAHLSA